MSTTRIDRRVNAPRAAVYGALLDPEAVQQWMVPEGMRSEVHAFEPREGGSIRISLTYDAPDALGKTSAHTDTYHGRFVRLVVDEEVVETMEFETDNPSMQGEMTVTYTLSDADGGTLVQAVQRAQRRPTRRQRARLDDVARQARRPTRGGYFAALISSRNSLRI